MHLSSRPARPEEIVHCFAQMGMEFVYPADLRSFVPVWWARWLKDGVLNAQVIESVGRGAPQAVALGAVAFVRESVLDSFCRQRRPYFGAELIRRAAAGDSVVLTPEEMRAAHRGEGLTLFFLSDPLGHRHLTDEARRLVDAKWSESLYELRGCNIKAMWHEVYGEPQLRRSLGCGLRTRHDWAEHAAAYDDPDERPYLLGLTRAEAEQQPGTHASFLFQHVAPRFGFTVRQQELLHRALSGATDDELAAELSVSLSAVKKRWISVYENVSVALPGWLESAAPTDARGSEKRRHLLNYLRQHPEELHPACATRD